MPIDPLDFDADVAPLRNRFGLTRHEDQRLMDANNERVAPQLDMIMKLQGHLSRERNSKLSFRVNKFEINKKREASKKEAEYLWKTEDATEELNDIVDNPSLNPYQRQRGLSQFALNNPELVRWNPMVNQMLQAANLTTKADLQNIQSRDEASGYEMQAANSGFLDPEFLRIQYGKDPTSKQKANLLVADAAWKRKAKDNERQFAIDTMNAKKAERDFAKSENTSYQASLDDVQARVAKARELDDDLADDGLARIHEKPLIEKLEIIGPDGKAVKFTSRQDFDVKMTRLRGESHKKMIDGGASNAALKFPNPNDPATPPPAPVAPDPADPADPI
jgi:hypothetical protein|tara:strand:- start:145 stop:1146 length:1002 start_codon:yes stop_codon:yes gene_type:complete